MQSEKNKLIKLQWDSTFFGYNIGKINLDSLCANELLELQKEARAHHLSLVYLFTDPNDGVSNTSAKNIGGILYDEKTTYLRRSAQIPAPLHSNIKSYTSDLPASLLYPLALQSGIYSRFFLDQKFINNEFQKLYQAWTENSVNRSLAKEVLVYTEQAHEYLGLITLGIKVGRLDIGLLAVEQAARGRNIGGKLLSAADYYSNLWKCEYMQVVTQGANKIACNFYEKHGFRKESVQQVFHLWV